MRTATAAGLDDDHPGDGDAYRRLMAEWDSLAPHFMDSLLSPFPPVRHGLRLLRTAGPTGLRALARRSIIPLGRFTDEEFGGSGGALLFAGMALHADLTPMSAGGALFGWMLTSLGQRVGFPVPVGGAGMLTASLVARLEAGGGAVRCGARVVEVVVRDGRATVVRLAGGEELGARRAIVADTDAGRLYGELLRDVDLPASVTDRLRRIERGAATVKLDWALGGPIPWRDPSIVGAGTVHVADSLDELTITTTQIATRQMPQRPFLLLGQMTTSDATRSPAGTESAWAYTHTPQGLPWERSDVDRMVDAMEQRVEDHAPGFRDSILARHVMSPIDMEREDANLVGGDISGGTAQLHQQLVFRPMPGWGRPETAVAGLYLGSASAHPGGAVHGACGANAARAALAHQRAQQLTLGVAGRVARRRRGDQVTTARRSFSSTSASDSVR